MKTQSKPLLIANIIFITMAINAPESKSQEYRHFEIVKLEEGIYTAIHKEGGHAICNAGIIDLGTETLIFDTFITPQAADELLKAIADLDLPQIRFVVNSHHHNDHVRGNQVFDESVFILSSEKTRELMEMLEPEQIKEEKVFAPERYEGLRLEKEKIKDPEAEKEIQMWLGYYEGMIASHPILVTTLPVVTFTGEFSIRGSSKKIELMEFTGGHTASDVVMYLPEEKILFTGDLLFVDTHPYLGDGILDSWIENLEKIKEMDVEIFIPGHGPPGKASDLDELIAYIQQMKELVQKSKEEGKTIEEVLALPIPAAYKDWNISSFYALNLKILYNQ